MTASPDRAAAGVCVIAEIGSVHDGSFGNACRLIDLAAELGADAVKFQTHLAEAESLADAPSPPYFSAEPRLDYFRRTAFSPEQWREIAGRCEAAGVEFLSSPFSIEAVALLETLGMRRFKIPSGEVTNIPLLREVGMRGKPVLLSSGMSNWAELDRAMGVLLDAGADVTVLQCASAYPCPEERVGLNVITEMQARYGVPVGLSDHTAGNEAALAAVVLGAVVIEKHLTFSRAMYGSDAPYAAEPGQFCALVSGIRALERMLGNPVDKDDLTPYLEMKSIFEKSVVTLVPISAGTALTRDMLGTKKPGTGLAPERLPDLLGRRALRDLPADALLREQDLELVTEPGQEN